MQRAYLGLGSDLGNRVRQLRSGVRALRAEGLRTGRISPLYLTEPVGDPALPWFVNCAVEVLDAPPPARLLEAALAAERACGRRRRGRGLEARSLDVDILLYDRRRIAEPGIEIPHPRLHERRFALRPLADLEPEAVHPVTGSTVGEHLERLAATERVWLLAPCPWS